MNMLEVMQAIGLVFQCFLVPMALALHRLDKNQAVQAQAMSMLARLLEQHMAADERAITAIHRRLDHLKVPPAGALEHRG